jgi:predicted carbohydrate-binding protein with CBM5 and CBM33 domain
MHLTDTPHTRPWLPRVLLALAVAFTAALALVASPGTADAHGSTIDPPSRAYGCWDRWGGAEPDAAADPMCHRTWQESPGAIWGWKAVYANNLGNNYQSRIPDGQICSAGHGGEQNYAPLDNPGPWRAKDVGPYFSVNVYDEARHGADWLHVYVTEQGYDPSTEPLGWDDLELVATTGSYPGGSSPNYVTNVAAQGRSGHHVVLTVWRTSHMDQKYFLCSDVNFA